MEARVTAQSQAPGADGLGVSQRWHYAPTRAWRGTSSSGRGRGERLWTLVIKANQGPDDAATAVIDLGHFPTHGRSSAVSALDRA
jgi:hypothetical protein